MQKTFAKLSVFILSALFLLACKKDVKETNIDSNIRSNVKADNGNTIRLTSAVHQFGSQTFSYNSDGLMDEWYISGIEFTTKIEYDEDGRFSKSEVYIGSVLAYTIYFVYEKNQVVKEIWYSGTTDDIFDEVFYTFDASGVMLKSESFIQNYYSLYEYTKDRQLSIFTLFINDVPVVKVEYTYFGNYKSPYDAIPGFTYAFVFSDGVYYANRIYSTSASSTYYDENGAVMFEDVQDPALTIMEPGPEHYPATASYYSLLADASLDFTFTYENCGSCPDGKIGRNVVNNNSLRSSLNKFLAHDPKHQMKDKAAVLRMDVRKFKKG